MSCYVGMAVPSFAMPVFDNASTFPLIAVTMLNISYVILLMFIFFLTNVI